MMEHIDRPFCPDPQVLGAFVEGTLAMSDLTGVRDHLATCNDCLDEVGEAAEQVRTAPVTFQPRRPRVSWLPVAAGIAVAVIGGGVLYQMRRDPVDALRQVQMSKRYVEPRLTGFPWAEHPTYRGSNESSADTETIQLDSAIYKLRENLDGHSDAKAQHAVGVSFLVAPRSDDARKPDEAIKKLAEAVKTAPNDPEIRNDYAAALWEAQKQTEALDQVTIVLRQKPDFPEALYNQALFLQRLDRQKDAAAAWQRYFQVDPNSKWADDARNLLRDLQ